MFIERNRAMISSAIAQTLTSATSVDAHGVPWYGWALVIVVGLAIGYILLKRKNPAAATVVSADAQHVGAVIIAELGKLRDLVERKVAPAPAAAPADQTAALAQVTAERDALQAKLDDIKAKLA
jgi:hypothetical protein